MQGLQDDRDMLLMTRTQTGELAVMCDDCHTWMVGPVRTILHYDIAGPYGSKCQRIQARQAAHQ